MPAEYGEPLTEREIEIVRLVADGLTNREIALRTYLSPNTVKVHLRNIFTKTGVASRTELTVMAMQEGWVTVPRVIIAGNEAPPAEAQPVAVAQTPLNEVPTEPSLPPWPRSRWIVLAMALLLAIVVLVLPQRPAGQAATPTGSGLVDQPQAPPIVAGPTGKDGWRELNPLPVRRARMGVTAYGGQIYVVGGMTENGLTGRLDIYDIGSGDWRSGAARPAALANIGMVGVGDRLLVPGGCDADGVPQTVTHLYDPLNDTWSEAAALPKPLCAYALTGYDGRAYLFGGWDGTTYRAVAYVYNPTDNTWTEIARPNEARGFGAAADLSDRIFYVGGYDDRHELATCEVYFPQNNRWEKCAPLLLPRGGLGLAAIGGRLYALGGGWTSYLGFNERYDPANDMWMVIKTPIVGEWRNLGLTVYETSLYAVGGWSGDYLNRVYTIEIMPWRVFIPASFFSP